MQTRRGGGGERVREIERERKTEGVKGRVGCGRGNGEVKRGLPSCQRWLMKDEIATSLLPPSTRLAFPSPKSPPSTWLSPTASPPGAPTSVPNGIPSCILISLSSTLSSRRNAPRPAKLRTPPPSTASSSKTPSANTSLPPATSFQSPSPSLAPSATPRDLSTTSYFRSSPTRQTLPSLRWPRPSGSLSPSSFSASKLRPSAKSSSHSSAHAPLDPLTSAPSRPILTSLPPCPR